jgi:hypothetical protein
MENKKREVPANLISNKTPLTKAQVNYIGLFNKR